MADNYALELSKQKKFVKSLKGIKKLVNVNKNIKNEPEKDQKLKTKDGRIKKSFKKRGLVYLSHIPHGFYENEMTQYFKQFGVVTNVRVIRSKRTGNAKGFAFVEFKEPAVAQIVAETMNNYLMGKRLIKAAYVPPDKQRKHALRKHWNKSHNPGTDLRLKMKKAYNENKDEGGELKRARKLMSNLQKTAKKLSEMGINYTIIPSDIPEKLVVNKEESDDDNEEVKENVKIKVKNMKKNKKSKGENIEVKTEQLGPVKVKKGKDKVSKEIKAEQKEKNKKQKELGVKSIEEFMKVEMDSSTSDDTDYEFDSDEYENMLGDDDEFDSNLESDDTSVESGNKVDNDENGNKSSGSLDDQPSLDDSVEESTLHPSPPKEISPLPKKGKNKHLPKVLHPAAHTKTSKNKTNSQKQSKKQSVEMKRKLTTETAAAVKKANLEKQTDKKLRNKRFIKKK